MENNKSYLSYDEINYSKIKDYSQKFYGSFLNKSITNNQIEKTDIFLCLICNQSPKINFITRDTIDLCCKCVNIKSFPIKKIDKYMINFKNDNKIKINFPICKTHKKSLFFYCPECKFDICRECLTKMIAHLGH